MGILDDTAIFAAVLQQGGFSHAARHLGLSNGLISRRISQLEASLGVTLIKRTTRQLHLTQEGELFWQHAQRIQQELDSAVNLIQSSVKKPKGRIRISAPYYFGRNYLTPIIMKFMHDFDDIKIDLILSDNRLDIVKEQIDIAIRGAGYIDKTSLKDSSMRMKLLFREKICLYASPTYLQKFAEPVAASDLANHQLIHYADHKQLHEQEKWSYTYKNKSATIALRPQFICNDIDSNLRACIDGYGIGKFTDLNVADALQKKLLRPLLQQYNWGTYNLYIIYPQQQALPRRTRLLLEFIHARVKL